MVLEKANGEQLDEIEKYYNYVSENTPDVSKYCRWKVGKYPVREDISKYIQNDSLYVYKVNQIIVGAIAITVGQSADYEQINWKCDADFYDITSLHILSLNPDYQGKGLGRELVKAAIELTKEQGKKVIRLDALATNLPARKLYESLGFEYRGSLDLYADNTGITEFCFYELGPIL